jgi:hypothetical protein
MVPVQQSAAPASVFTFRDSFRAPAASKNKVKARRDPMPLRGIDRLRAACCWCFAALCGIMEI